MQIVKDKKITEDNFEYLEDDSAIRNGDIIISFSRWNRSINHLSSHQGRLGLRIIPTDSLLELDCNLEGIALIELFFPEFADGQLFSHAWLLRQRYQYQGELRASGQFIPDQAFYLSRVGINAFAPEKAEHLPIILNYLNDFSVTYQQSVN